MGNIQFLEVNFWDRSTMELGSVPTTEQWEEVKKIATQLTNKYEKISGCRFHPNKIQKICVSLTNKKVDFQIQKKDTCECQGIVDVLIKIRNHEWANFNAVDNRISEITVTGEAIAFFANNLTKLSVLLNN